jgi:signal transduction histidine kinase
MSPVAPAIVAVIGIAAAVVIVLLGVAQLQRTSDDAASLRARALATTTAARLSAVGPDAYAALLERLTRRSGAEILLVERPSGVPRLDHSLGGLEPIEIADLLVRGEGLRESRLGRVRYATTALAPDLAVVVLVGAPSPPEGSLGLVRAVAVLTLLLVGMAVAVALAFMRATRDDVAYVRQRIAGMAQEGAGVSAARGRDPRTALVPVRSLDQVGQLTAALNTLCDRFAAAERGYRADLEQAAQLDNERSQFLAGLSHELRTPLNAILGFTHLLETEAEGPLTVEAREALSMIRQAGEHLKSLIDDILDLSAMETGQLRLSRAVVDVRAVAEGVLREARATLKDRPIELRIEGQHHCLAWADPRRLRQILTNLLSNALKATARGAVTVTVNLDLRSHLCVLEVADSGSGIPREMLDTIFEPFRQAGDAATRRGGAGLGLAITRRLVLLHGGTLHVESELGRGSVFTVWLPDDTHSTKMPRDSLVPWSEGSSLSEGAPDSLGPPAPAGVAERSAAR